MKISKKPTNNPTGRPTKMTPEVIERLESMIRKGISVKHACFYVGIERRSYYKWIKKGVE